MSPNINQFDNLLNELNGFGKYQILNLCLTSITAILIGISTFNFIFVTAIPEYRCRIPICENYTVSEYTPNWLPNAVPFKNGLPQHCTRYALRNEFEYTFEYNCSKELFNDNKIVQCNSDNLVFFDTHTTILNDLNIVCEDQQWKLSLIGTFSSLGTILSGPICGYISDKYGRKKILIVMAVFITIFGVAKSFTDSLEAYIILDVFETMAGHILFSAAFIIGMELVSPSYRSVALMSYGICLAFGQIVLGIAAWYFNSWRVLLRVLYIPGLLVISYWWLIPESIRWLVCMKKFDEVFIILEKIAKRNNRSLPENYTKIFQNDGATKTKMNFKEAFKNRTLCLRLINSCIIKVANSIIYYGLSLNSVTLSGNKYLNFVIMATVEIPANILCVILLMRFSRRLTVGVSYFMTGIFCLLLYFLDGHYISVIIYTCGKLMATVAGHTVVMFISELFPTEVRQSFFNICSVFGGLGAMISPQIPLLVFIWNPLPILTFGSFAFLICVLISFFPETHNESLCDTLEEIEITSTVITEKL